MMAAEGTDERVLALRTEVTTIAAVKLAGESDESASFTAWSDDVFL